jgi:hypothetical protein
MLHCSRLSSSPNETERPAARVHPRKRLPPLFGHGDLPRRRGRHCARRVRLPDRVHGRDASNVSLPRAACPIAPGSLCPLCQATAAASRLSFKCRFRLLSYIFCLMPNGPKTYEVLLRRLCRDSAAQWAYAAVGFVACLFGGFGLFLLIQTEHVVDRKEVSCSVLTSTLPLASFPARLRLANLGYTFKQSSTQLLA